MVRDLEDNSDALASLLLVGVQVFDDRCVCTVVAKRFYPDSTRRSFADRCTSTSYNFVHRLDRRASELETVAELVTCASWLMFVSLAFINSPPIGYRPRDATRFGETYVGPPTFHSHSVVQQC